MLRSRIPRFVGKYYPLLFGEFHAPIRPAHPQQTPTHRSLGHFAPKSGYLRPEIDTMKKFLLTLILGAFLAGNSRADEGMWPLTMLAQLQDAMQAKGLKLSAEDIYSINKSCLKDAVVRLSTKQGRMFCSGEIISDQGLFLTNHHCGFGAIQELSSPADNILENGFWAKDRSQEKPANFHIMLLAKVEDVTDKVLNGIAINGAEAERNKAVSEAVTRVTKELSEAEKAGGHEYRVELVPFYNGNRYLAMYYVVHKDIRLVGTPPQNIGKFGGETDNWSWPRHTADFSMFRIYAGADNKPAEYNAANKPYKPAHFFPVSLKGMQEGDFAMIMGYPGRTARYTYSEGVRFISEKDRPARVDARREILDIYEEFMFKDPVIKLMYADKYAGLSNYWKKFMGERDGLKKLNIYDRRKAEERAFETWNNANELRKATYGEVTGLYDEAYRGMSQYGMFGLFLGEAIFNAQPFSIAAGMGEMAGLLASKNKDEVAKGKEMAAKMRDGIDEMYKEFHAPLEQKVLAAMVKRVYENLDPALQPAGFRSWVAKYKFNYDALAADMFKRSLFTNANRLKAFLAKPSAAMQKDPIMQAWNGFLDKNKELAPIMNDINSKLNRANRLFQSAMIEMNKDKMLTPDANATMRLTYGTVQSYVARDAVHYSAFTTHRGVVEKYMPGDIEFDAPKKLIDMLKAKDFGQYADKNGDLPSCFLTNHDITGGNSGSPVLNAEGHLIGTAFDGNWEAISSDFAFEPDLQRTISVDIRYTLFIVDKFGGAGHLLNEMKIIR
jgi:hypothetical protein